LKKIAKIGLCVVAVGLTVVALLLAWLGWERYRISEAEHYRTFDHPLGSWRLVVYSLPQLRTPAFTSSSDAPGLVCLEDSTGKRFKSIAVTMTQLVDEVVWSDENVEFVFFNGEIGYAVWPLPTDSSGAFLKQ
jgi:hypothetical protein